MQERFAFPILVLWIAGCGSAWAAKQAPERMQEPPAISTDKGEVSLGDVAAWLGTDKGVVVREGSLYLIERGAAGLPAAPATNVQLYWQPPYAGARK
jgi:hypothetical protein